MVQAVLYKTYNIKVIFLISQLMIVDCEQKCLVILDLKSKPYFENTVSLDIAINMENKLFKV